ncbi:Oidioi.mRNA.OKI2018_I69.XSR.g14480.t2.cds [Oikopleura dioica]|uniref:Oidioi.mRNA.OKI2018_I69.XSR.g14480.t2.cds n=1 Tax=Oikopleura dioica TaxID=34765 RepID=A0ABN7SF58_OIKDI|nr:Oidioi.mRNA.OKI2018_I69.XSR.g14480.t2.cds [Oikopleura dioica]
MNNSNESYVGDPMVSQPEHAYHQTIPTNNQLEHNPNMQTTRLPVPTMQPQHINQNQNSVMSPQMSDTASMKTESPAEIKNQMPNTPGSMNSMSADSDMQRNASIVSATKVAEVLKVAGEAFQRLGECTMFLDFHSVNNKSKWMPSDVDKLQEAVQNFKDDLGTISNTMQKRTSQKLKENLHKHFGNSVNNRMQTDQMTKKPRMQQVASPAGQAQSQLRQNNSMGANQKTMNPHLQQPMQQQQSQTSQQQLSQQVAQQGHQIQQTNQQQQNQQQQQPRLSGSVPMSPGQNQNPTLQMQRGHSQQNAPLQHLPRSGQSGSQSNYIVQSPGSGQRLIQTSQHQDNQQQPSSRVVSTATTMVLGSDQQKGGQQYTVKQTIIDGKRTLILDHSDLQRLINSNSGNAPASLILPTTSSVDSNGQNQTVMVMTSQPSNQNGARQNQ